VLPNFRRGHKGATGQTEGGYDLRIGRTVVERTHEEYGGWHYTVRSVNTTSGEELQLSFSCTEDKYRALTGRWQVQAENNAGDLYHRFHCFGSFEERKDGQLAIRLKMNGLEIIAGFVEGSVPLTCNWSLLDVIPSFCDRLGSSSGYVEIALLEDLEKFRPCNRVGCLENWTLDLGQRHEELVGYFLHGEGIVPSYWWVDRFSNVVIVSSTLQTLVMKESQISGGVK